MAHALAELCLLFRDEPTILGWSLANEPKCEGDYSGSVLSVRPPHASAHQEHATYRLLQALLTLPMCTGLGSNLSRISQKLGSKPSAMRWH